MKFIYLFILCNLSTNCFSQTAASSLKNTFVLNGQVTGRETGRMILKYQDSTNNWLSDTTCLKNGKFTFKGFIDQPTFAILGDPKYVNFGEVNTVTFFMEPKEMTVQLIEGDYENANFKGSNIQEDYKLFLKEENAVTQKWKSITEEREKLLLTLDSIQTDSIDTEIINRKLDLIRPKMDQRNQEMADIRYKYIAQFPDSYISAFFLALTNKRPSIEFQRAAYEKFSHKVKNSRYGQYLKDEIQRRILVDIGAAAPDFSGISPEGKTVQLSDLKGKIVLIDFWASWCVPCREGIPNLKKYYDQYNSKGFEIVTISIDRRKSDWERAVLEEKIPYFHNVLVNEEITNGYENVWRPIPSQILINQEGVIIWKKTADIEKDPKSLVGVLVEKFGGE